MLVELRSAKRSRKFVLSALLSGMIVAGSVLLLVLTPGSASGALWATQTPTATPDRFPVPFHPESIWNNPIDPDVRVHPNSEHWMDILLNEWNDPDIVPLDIDGIEWGWSVPIYEAEADTPLSRICSDDYTTHCADVPIPDDLIVSPDGDGKVVVVDRYAEPPRAWSFWRLFQAGGEVAYTAALGAYGWTPIDNSGDGLVSYDGGQWGGRAAGWNYYAGLIHPEEIRQGVIEHALVIIIPGQVVADEPVWPALASDGYAEDPNPIPLGVRFQLDPSIDVDSLPLSRGARIVARALQEYGAWLGDTGSLIALNAREYVYRDEYGGVRIDPSPWEGLLGGGELNRLYAHNLRIVEVNPDDFYQLPQARVE